MHKIKTKTIYVNKELDKRINEKDKASVRAYKEQKEDPISRAFRESNKSPRKMFKQSMSDLQRLLTKNK